jgi:streptomycin 6-kinase
VTYPDERLIGPATIEAIRRYRLNANGAIAGALGRTREALEGWDLVPVRPLAGGAMSVVLLVTRADVPMVLKVPLDGTADVEVCALRALRGAPRIFEASPSALLLEYLDGAPVDASDGGRVAEALVLAASLWDCRDGALFASWQSHLRTLLAEYATRIITRSPVPEARDLARELLAEEVDLASALDLVPSHGDLQAKNLLATPTGVRVLDPLAVLAPRGYDAAFAIVSVVAAGGDPSPVVDAARVLALGDLWRWLRVAALNGAGSSGVVDDGSVAQRLLDLLH